MEDRIPPCGEVPALVCPVRPLLAAGPVGACRLSPRLDPSDSLSDRGYCRRWCDRTPTQHHHASRKTGKWTARPLTPVVRGRIVFVRCDGCEQAGVLAHLRSQPIS